MAWFFRPRARDHPKWPPCGTSYSPPSPKEWSRTGVGAATFASTARRSGLPRRVDLRPFAVNDGAQVRVLPGGLTRVALREGEA